MHPTVEPIEQLAAAAMRGDRAALRALWEQHRRYAATVILAHKPASADADDLLQDVAATLVGKIHTLSDPAHFLAWMRMIALNVARAAGRRHAASPVQAGSEVIGQDEGGATARVSIEQQHHQRERADDARSLLDLARELPEEYREPLLLQALKDLSYRQIARVMNLPETTVETRIARARKMLREAARKKAESQAGGGARMASATATV